MALSPRDSHNRRSERNRIRLRKLANGRPRLSIFRSSKNIYAQVIDDASGVTVAAASSLESKKKAGGDKAAAAEVGKLVVVGITAIGAVAWLAGLAAMLRAERDWRESSREAAERFDAEGDDDEEHGQETEEEASAHGYLRIENQRAPTRRRSTRTTTT